MATVVSITNPITGAVEQVDKLDHTAQQIDDAVALAPQLSNPNLLDNWYFGNIIDQRNGWIIPPGLTAYSDSSLSTVYGKTTNYRPVVDIASNYVSFLTSDGLVKYVAPGSEIRGYTGTVYGPDRWKHGNNPTSILLVKDDALVVKIIDNYTSSSARTLHQKVDNVNQLFGKTVTASFLVDDISGSEFMVGYRASVGSNVLSKYIRVTTPGVYSATFQVQDGTTELLANVITDGSTKIDDYISIKAAKLELGSQQTLAHQENGVWVLNEIPDFGEQLARCQRHQFNANPKRYGRPSIGVSTSQSSGAFVLSLPVTMRAIPTVTFRNLQVFYLGQNYNVTSINVSGMTDNAVLLDITFDATIPNGAALILVANEGSELLLTANL